MMGRLRRFAEFRYVGVRSTMTVYDCDDDGQFAELSALVQSGDLVATNQLSTFAPDTLPEARNRGFEEVGR